MKNWALFAASGALFMATQALAGDTATSNITLSGTVAKFCSMSSPTLSGEGMLLPGASLDGTVAFQNFVETDGTHQPHMLTITYPGAMCNYSASLGLKSAKSGLRPQAIAPSGFAGIVHYTATATWGTATTKLTTSSQSLGDNNALSLPPLMADLVVQITTAPSVLPLIADGTPYTDTLTIQLGQKL